MLSQPDETRSAASLCDRAGCGKPITNYDAVGQWCEEHAGGRAAATRPPWHGNWARTWKLGPVSFEIEWLPRASQYSFYLSFDFSRGRYDD